MPMTMPMRFILGLQGRAKPRLGQAGPAVARLRPLRARGGAAFDDVVLSNVSQAVRHKRLSKRAAQLRGVARALAQGREDGQHFVLPNALQHGCQARSRIASSTVMPGAGRRAASSASTVCPRLSSQSLSLSNSLQLVGEDDGRVGRTRRGWRSMAQSA